MKGISINKKNLQRMVGHIRDNVTDEMFDMYDYRKGSGMSPICDSVGCVIGHCTILDKNNIHREHSLFGGRIDFTGWSFDFTNLDPSQDLDELVWEYLFTSEWVNVDNTRQGFINRATKVINSKDISKLDLEIK